MRLRLTLLFLLLLAGAIALGSWASMEYRRFVETPLGLPDEGALFTVKPGATVIDVGTNRVDDPSREKGYRLTGDVAFDEVKEVAGAVSPSPGGVGPMTIAMLLANTVRAAKIAAGKA